MDGGSIPYFDDWLELVITHELVHTFHFEMAGPRGKVARRVFGRCRSGCCSLSVKSSESVTRSTDLKPGQSTRFH